MMWEKDKPVEINLTVSSSQRAITQFPHCDQKVLHAPGECEFCDAHKDWQELRKAWGIRFTGHSYDGNKVDGEMSCPAEFARTIHTIEAWSGNRPKPPLPQWIKDVAYELWGGRNVITIADFAEKISNAVKKNA